MCVFNLILKFGLLSTCNKAIWVQEKNGMSPFQKNVLHSLKIVSEIWICLEPPPVQQLPTLTTKGLFPD